MADSSLVEPDFEAIVAQAIGECDRAALETALRDDPLRLPFVALASFLRAQRTLYHDGRHPALVEAARQAGRQGFAMAAREAVRTWTWRRWSYVASACAIVGTCLFLGGYRTGISAANVPPPAGQTAMQLVAYVSAWCADRGHLISEKDGMVCPVKFPMSTEAKTR
jgi:hypothetical protein